MTEVQAAERGGPRTGAATPGSPTAIAVYYDPTCELCRRYRAWLEVQPTWVPLSFVPTTAEAARVLLPQIPWLGTELVVVADDGATWIGPAAFLTCLWATRRYRGWSRRLAGPAFAPLAERFFHSISSNRGRIGAFLTTDDCTSGACRHHVEPTLGMPPPCDNPPWNNGPGSW